VWVSIKQQVIESGGRGAQVGALFASVARLSRVRTVTEDYTATPDDYTVVVDASAESVTVTLPATPPEGLTLNIACLDDTNGVTVDFNGNGFYVTSSTEALYFSDNLRIIYTGATWIGV
jgi:hypothetical protein